MGVEEKQQCPLCENLLDFNYDEQHIISHRFKNIEHSLFFQCQSFYTYWELSMNSYVIDADKPQDRENVVLHMELKYCPCCGRKLTKTVDK